MEEWIRLVGPEQAVEFLGVRLVGVNAETGKKLLFTLVFIALEVAERHTIPISDLSDGALREMQRRYAVKAVEIKPKVYYRLTDNWLELTVRFIVKDHGIRGLKDAMSRDILRALDEAGIGIASATFEVVGLPPLRIDDGRGTGLENVR